MAVTAEREWCPACCEPHYRGECNSHLRVDSGLPWPPFVPRVPDPRPPHVLETLRPWPWDCVGWRETGGDEAEAVLDGEWLLRTRRTADGWEIYTGRLADPTTGAWRERLPLFLAGPVWHAPRSWHEARCHAVVWAEWRAGR